jgi:hypothetical protein
MQIQKDAQLFFGLGNPPTHLLLGSFKIILIIQML